MKHAKYVIGLHGAGLANILFMKKGGHVIELSPTISNKKNFRIPFWRLANAIEARFSILFCDNGSSYINEPYDTDLKIQIMDLEKIIHELK